MKQPVDVRELRNEMIEFDVIDDRREYSVEDLQHAYLLSFDEAVALSKLIEDYFK